MKSGCVNGVPTKERRTHDSSRLRGMQSPCKHARAGPMLDQSRSHNQVSVLEVSRSRPSAQDAESRMSHREKSVDRA
jgi:hypothetical protein